jgi:hypothetical protein
VIQGGGNMPAYGKNLSPAETTALVAFLVTLNPAELGEPLELVAETYGHELGRLRRSARVTAFLPLVVRAAWCVGVACRDG